MEIPLPQHGHVTLFPTDIADIPRSIRLLFRFYLPCVVLFWLCHSNSFGWEKVVSILKSFDMFRPIERHEQEDVFDVRDEMFS